MTNFDLDCCMSDIEARWPDQMGSAVAGDLRSVLEHYDYDLVSDAIRAVRLESSYKTLPVGKIVAACRKKNPSAGKMVSKGWDIFIQNTVKGYFRQICTPANLAEHQVMAIAESQKVIYERQTEQEWRIVKGATFQDMALSCHEIYKKGE